MSLPILKPSCDSMVIDISHDSSVSTSARGLLPNFAAERTASRSAGEPDEKKIALATKILKAQNIIRLERVELKTKVDFK